MGNANWFYKNGGQVHGPLSPNEMRQKAAVGEILPDTMVRKGADGGWVRAAQVRGIFEATTLQPAAIIRFSSVRLWIRGHVTSRQLRRLTPLLLIVTVGLLVLSVILQAIICTAILRPVDVSITNGEVGVNVTNREVPVNVRNHYIITSDPIPVEITNGQVPVNVENRELEVHVNP